VISPTRAALALSLVAAGALLGACSGLLGIDDVQYGGADGTVSGDGGANDGPPTGGDGGGGTCSKVCVVCVDAADPNTGCAGNTCTPCPGPANGVATCAAGQCAVGCAAPFSDCNGDASDGCEIDLTGGDPGNCGTCGKLCPGQVCNNGQCAAGCSGGQTNCDGGCFDLDASAKSCGACNAHCPAEPNANPVCTAGKCGITCSSGFLDCNGDASDGCEVIPNDPTHCGNCTTVCPAYPEATTTCNGATSTCGFSCNPLHEDCNRAASDGCECNLTTHSCFSGVCTICSAPKTPCVTVAECCNGGDPNSVACSQQSNVTTTCCIKPGFPYGADGTQCCSLTKNGKLCG